MSAKEQKKGAAGERELADILIRAGYPVRWGGNKTYGAVPDLSGLAGVHIECKRVERLNLSAAMEQSERDARRFGDEVPTVFHRRNHKPWLVTMRLTDWLQLYDRNAHARFFTDHEHNTGKGEETMGFWESEKPIAASTERNVLEYFPEAKNLSISKPNWVDKDGNDRRGKTVFLDLSAVAKCPAALQLLERVLADLKGA